MRCSFFATLAILAGALLSAAAVRTELWVETTTISKPSQLPGQTIQGWKCSHCGLESWNRNACRLQYHLASQISLRDEKKGFFGAELCTKAPEDIQAKAKAEIEGKGAEAEAKGKRKAESSSTADEEGSERASQMKQSVSSLDNKPVAKIKADNSVSDFFDGTATPHALVEHVLFTRMISDIVAAGPG